MPNRYECLVIYLKVYLFKIQELNEFNEWCPLNFEFNFIQ